MATAVGLRDAFTAVELRRLVQSRSDGGQVRRLALAVNFDGCRREAARIGGVGLRAVRDWVPRFNRGGPDGLVDGKILGISPRLDPI